MELLEIAERIYQSPDPAVAFGAMVDGLTGQILLQAAFQIDASDRTIVHRWPAGSLVSPDLLDTALHVLRPEVFPIGSEFPVDSTTYSNADMLLLPLRSGEKRSGVCVLIAQQDAFGEDPEHWRRVLAALEHIQSRHGRLCAAERECEDLRRRVEESEALHTLGLAANRTLDMAEVLNLVAPFTRTLLGAHYVTVNTIDAGLIYNVASVGLRNAEAGLDDYHLARTVVEAEKPLVIGGAEANLQVDNFPFHAAEGMKAGVGIPLSLFGDTFGALLVGYRRPYEVTPRDIRLGITLAGHAAVAISNARLHATVEERSHQLQAAYEQLDNLTKAKERFFASINHELRNPLGAIVNYIELVLDGTGGELPQQSRVFLEKARRAGHTLRTLVNDILDLSKLAAGKMNVNLQRCTVVDIVEGVLNTIQPLADGKGLPLKVELAPELPIVTTDPDRAQQILVNLISNALKFTDDAGVLLRVDQVPEEADSRRGPPGTVEIRVIDTGPGINVEDQKRIFEEYEQVKGTKGGTGLGLPISRRLARALGGELWVESEPGVGSTFVLQLGPEVGTGQLVSARPMEHVNP